VTPPFETGGTGAYDALALDAETQAFVSSLATDGFALIDLGEEARGLCGQAAAEVEPWFERAPTLGRLQDAWTVSPAVRRLASWPKLKRMLGLAYGRRPFPFQTLNFQRGSEQALHADTVHFHSLPERFMCGVWIALEDIHPEAGPLVYYPGSHRLPVMTMQDAGVKGRVPTHDDYEAHFVPRFGERIAASGLPAAHAVIPKGWAFVWAANLAHGGAPIARKDATRRSLVVHWFFEDCLYYTPMTSNVDAGELALRVPADIETGRWMWPKQAGRPIYPGHRALVGALHRSLTRQPYAG
jgi:hypothetical protein